MFERETRREKILEGRIREIKLKLKSEAKAEAEAEAAEEAPPQVSIFTLIKLSLLS